jgi:hypothetical protein
VCNVSFIVYCALFERGVLFCVICVFVLCIIVVPLPPGKTNLQFKYNNNNNKYFHCDDPSSIPGYVILNLWWTKWHWGRFSISNNNVSEE